ncbi:MAG TPA: DUF4870 domain-containing protein [Lacibacter sp.]|nr:DUF4870 domain-containing protein [Lacibacter sp.]HMO88044.1 DUF4870 domain-containing protein [Lacibacter sp.]HMP87228.1 DUF4870 domain-containing protein [Lacibacter sp.]
MEPNFSQSSETQYTNVTSDEKTLAILSHLLGIFFSFIPALVIYLSKKDQSPYVAEHAKEALNFQLSILIYYIISGILVILLIGLLLLMVVYFGALILAIIATIKANDNVLYRYPFTIRIIK